MKVIFRDTAVNDTALRCYIEMAYTRGNEMVIVWSSDRTSARLFADNEAHSFANYVGGFVEDATKQHEFSDN